MREISAIKNEGWDIKPTKKSDDASEQSKMFLGSWRSEGVSHSAKITMEFKTIAAQDVKMFRIMLVIAVIT